MTTLGVEVQRARSGGDGPAGRSGSVARPSWPGIAPAPTGPRPPAAGLVRLAVAVPCAVVVLRHGGPWGVALAVVALAMALPGRPSPYRWVVPIAIGALAAGGTGPAWGLVLGIYAAGWSLAGAPSLVGGADAPARVPLVVGPLVLAGAWLTLGLSPAGIVAIAVLAVVVVLLERSDSRWSGRLAVTVERVGSVAGRVLGAALMVPVAALLTVVWGSHRVVRYDPLRDTGRGWLDRVGEDRYPDRQFASVTVPRRRGRRAHRLLASALVVAVVAGAVGYRLSRPESPPRSAAFADQANFDRLWAEMWTFSQGVRFDATSTFRMDDFAGRYVNQRDGARPTWRPPACSCRRVRVWWFGGSAAWGYYQSDEGSLPSQLAKVAWEQGVALDIENRALPGYTLGQEAQRFAVASTREPAPDLAVFYDGANELDFQVARNDAGRGADESPITYVDGALDLVFRGIGALQRRIPHANAGRSLPEDHDDPVLDAPELAGHSMARYRRGVELVERLAEPLGVEAVFAWQPTQTTAPPAVYAPFDGTGEWRPVDLEWWRRLSAAGRRGLPDQAIDLSDALDRAREPTMPDWAHTNEAGARIVAEALYRQLVPRLPR